MVLRIFSISCFVFLFASCSETAEPVLDAGGNIVIDGKKLFNVHCAACHRYNGTGGVSGAKDLTTTQMRREEMVSIIHQGSGDMMPFKDMLSNVEIEAVVDHIQTLKK